jgi:predicted Ser/Thr protein kinase
MRVALGTQIPNSKHQTPKTKPAKPSAASSADDPLPDPAKLAACFPQLEILELLGKGGMGAVYKARQPSLDRFVALKILPHQAAGDSGFAERFNREARALAKLNHPNIVAVYDFGQADGLHFLIMEFVDGANLRQIQRAGKLSPREALKVIPQICEALQFAHDEGIVHRDIKPENVLLDKKGRVKIADFGLARILGRESKDFRLTGAQDVMGTPHYMAPEQVERPQEVDHRADIYSLGVVFYEMLTGELPLGKFAPPSQKVQVDVRLDEVVLHALEKEPSRRYQHASEVKGDVETIASGTVKQLNAETPAPAARPEFWKFAVGALAAVVLLLLLLGLGVAALALLIPHLRRDTGPAASQHSGGSEVVGATAGAAPNARQTLLAEAVNRPPSSPAPNRAASVTPVPAAEQHEVQDVLSGLISPNVTAPCIQSESLELLPAGDARFQAPLAVLNDSGETWTTYGFINSDFVHITNMFQARHQPVSFETSHEGEHFQYSVTLNHPVASGESLCLTSEGTISGLVKSTGEPGVFEYSMRHWPQANQRTRRIELHLLPAGARLLDKLPGDLQERTRDGRIELFIDRLIPSGDSLEIIYHYRLDTPGK